MTDTSPATSSSSTSSTSSSSAPAAGSGTSPKEKSSQRKPSKKNLWHIILTVAVVIAVGLFISSEHNRRSTAQQLENTGKQLEELKAASEASDAVVTNEILAKVNALIDLPLTPQPLVARINDIEQLKAANEFFNVAKDGDYLILTGNRALLYDPERNIVLDVAPFSVRQDASPSPDADSSDAGTEQ